MRANRPQLAFALFVRAMSDEADDHFDLLGIYNRVGVIADPERWLAGQPAGARIVGQYTLVVGIICNDDGREHPVKFLCVDLAGKAHGSGQKSVRWGHVYGTWNIVPFEITVPADRPDGYRVAVFVDDEKDPITIVPLTIVDPRGTN